MTFKKILEMADYMIENDSTLREVAKEFGMSKSGVHYIFVEVLPEINYQKFCTIRNILNVHLKLAHIRGGEVTKNKYSKKI